MKADSREYNLPSGDFISFEDEAPVALPRYSGRMSDLKILESELCSSSPKRRITTNDEVEVYDFDRSQTEGQTYNSSRSETVYDESSQDADKSETMIYADQEEPLMSYSRAETSASNVKPATESRSIISRVTSGTDNIRADPTYDPASDTTKDSSTDISSNNYREDTDVSMIAENNDRSNQSTQPRSPYQLRPRSITSYTPKKLYFRRKPIISSRNNQPSDELSTNLEDTIDEET